MVRKCICDPTDGQYVKPDGTTGYRGRAVMIYNELASAGICLSQTALSTWQFTAKIFGYPNDVTVRIWNAYGQGEASITVGSKTTNTQGTSNVSDLWLFYDTDKSWFAIYAGNGGNEGNLTYFGKTDSGERIMFSSGTSTTYHQNGVIFLDDLTKNNGHIIASQLPIKISVTETIDDEDVTTVKWAERKLLICDSTDNLLRTEHSPEEEGDTTTYSDSFVLGVTNVAVEGITGMVAAPGLVMFRGGSIESPNAFPLYTPLKIDWDEEIDLTETQEESE